MNEENKELSRLKNLRRTILLVHEPPFGILDKIKNKESTRYGQHMGDKVLARFIKSKQPLLCICGHMHENQGKVMVGKTLVINPGDGGKGECALINLKNEKISVKFLML